MADYYQNVIVKTWKRIVRTKNCTLILCSYRLITGSIHSVLKLDSRHFGVVAASDYKSLGIARCLVRTRITS